MTLFFCHGRSDEDELWHTDAELHADILKFGMTIAQKLTSKLNAVILNTREQIYLLNVYMLTELNSYLSHLIIIIIVFMVLSSWQSHCESSPGSYDECRTAPSGRRPKTKPDDLGYESACTGCQNLHPPSPFIIITQPESWYSFYHPTEGRRLSRPSWLVTYWNGM